MEIWLDTIDCKTIEDGVQMGMISGITTNPSILSLTNNVFDTLSKILDIQPGPVAVQVTSIEVEEIVQEAIKLYEFSSRIVVKIPINRNGLMALKQVRHENIPTLGTAILSPSQVLLAANLGVNYVAPYFAHIGDFTNSCETLTTMIKILHANQLPTKMLVASLRHLDHLVFCASLGVEAVTIKPDLYYKLCEDHPQAEIFTKKFLSDWEQVHGKISVTDALTFIRNAAKY